MEQKYKRIDETILKEDIDKWLQTISDGWKIVNYNEIPSHKPTYIRMQILLEKEAESKSKKIRLFS